MSSDKWFFETQHLAHCAVHAVNNLLQAQVTDTATFNRVADRLASENAAQTFQLFNPHRVPILGFYDVNVLINVLQELSEYEVDWLDQRKYAEFAKHVDLQNDHDAEQVVVGIIVNIQQRTLFLKGICVLLFFFEIDRC